MTTEFGFQGKYLIYADMVCKTGLHVGGTEEGFEIGGLSNPVIRDPMTDFPYVPGSSLKGKMRSLVEWAIPGKHPKTRDEKPPKECVNETCVQYMLRNPKKSGSREEQQEQKKELLNDVKPCDCGWCDVCRVFGCSAEEGQSIGPTRLTVRDAMPDAETVSKWKEIFEEGVYTEVKMENTIGRITSAANPRPMERVPRGSSFRIKMVFDLYQPCDKGKLKLVFQALKLLEDSALGGSGTRGSGRVKFCNFAIVKRDVNYYQNGGQEIIIDLKGSDTPYQLLKNLSCILKGSGDGDENLSDSPQSAVVNG